MFNNNQIYFFTFITNIIHLMCGFSILDTLGNAFNKYLLAFVVSSILRYFLTFFVIFCGVHPDCLAYSFGVSSFIILICCEITKLLQNKKIFFIKLFSHYFATETKM